MINKQKTDQKDKEGSSLLNEAIGFIMKITPNIQPEKIQPLLELLYIIATTCQIPIEFSPYLKCHCARFVQQFQGQELNDLATSLYLRVWSNGFKKGKIKICGDFELKEIQSLWKNPNLIFGTSIYEQMYYQHLYYPELDFPIVLHFFCEKLFQLKAETSGGIFRLAGSKVNILHGFALANHGKNFLAESPINDVASLMKKWFSKQPGKLITPEEMTKFLEMKGNDRYIQFAESLPPAPKATLKYLVGFLRKLSEAQEVTKMSIANLSMVFAPNLAVLPKDHDSFANCSAMIQTFLTTLIKQWDISSLYPIKDNTIAPAKTEPNVLISIYQTL